MNNKFYLNDLALNELLLIYHSVSAYQEDVRNAMKGQGIPGFTDSLNKQRDELLEPFEINQICNLILGKISDELDKNEINIKEILRG